MFNEAEAWGSFSTDKLQDTFLFYSKVLGLTAEIKRDRFIHLSLPGGQPWVIYQKEDHQPATCTVLNFQVRNIKEQVEKLRLQGVEFLSYEAPFETDSTGISWDDEGSHIAWFKDPGGNIIALIEN